MAYDKPKSTLARRIVRRGARTVRRRYYRKKTGFNVAQIARDVALVKTMLNSEKKHKPYAPEAVYTVGQIFSDGTTTGSGHTILELTNTNHVPSSGSDADQRTGASIRVCSHVLRMQFWHQSGTAGPRSLNIYIVRTQGDMSFAVSEFVNPNTFISNNGGGNIYDNNSRRNQDFFKQFRILARKTLYIKNDDVSNEMVVKNLIIPMKFKTGNHIKFAGNTNTVSNGRTWLFITANAGNEGTGTPTAYTYIPTQTQFTGINFSYTNDFYYYDN
jgi:hypothetical protein